MSREYRPDFVKIASDVSRMLNPYYQCRTCNTTFPHGSSNDTCAKCAAAEEVRAAAEGVRKETERRKSKCAWCGTLAQHQIYACCVDADIALSEISQCEAAPGSVSELHYSIAESRLSILEITFRELARDPDIIWPYCSKKCRHDARSAGQDDPTPLLKLLERVDGLREQVQNAKANAPQRVAARAEAARAEAARAEAARAEAARAEATREAARAEAAREAARAEAARWEAAGAEAARAVAIGLAAFTTFIAMAVTGGLCGVAIVKAIPGEQMIGHYAWPGFIIGGLVARPIHRMSMRTRNESGEPVFSPSADRYSKIIIIGCFVILMVMAFLPG